MAAKAARYSSRYPGSTVYFPVVPAVLLICVVAFLQVLLADYAEKLTEVKKLAKYKVQDVKEEDGVYTVSVQVEPSNVFQTLQQSSAEVSKEKIAHGMKETDPGVFASVLTESVQKSIDKNSYGDPVTVTVKVEKNHSRTYELSETERSKLETAMFPTE